MPFLTLSNTSSLCLIMPQLAATCINWPNLALYDLNLALDILNLPHLASTGLILIGSTLFYSASTSFRYSQQAVVSICPILTILLKATSPCLTQPHQSRHISYSASPVIWSHLASLCLTNTMHQIDKPSLTQLTWPCQPTCSHHIKITQPA